MKIEDWDELHAMVIDAGDDLLRAIGLPATYMGTTPLRDVAWAETLSIIGLAGNLRGSLVLSVPSLLVRRSHPTGGTHHDELADWLAELANLLLGGIKMRLLARDVSIALSTPLAITASTFRVERFVGIPVAHTFRCEGETICFVFEAISNERAALSSNRIPVAAKSGDLITF